jgi:RHS repeat-associated protein
MKILTNHSGMRIKKINFFYRLLSCYLVLFMFASSTRAQLTISSPVLSTSNTIQFTLSGAQSTNAHVIFFSPQLAPDINGWNRLATGTVGQVTFNLSKPTNANAFFAAGITPIGTPTVATPVFSPVGGSYANPINITITTATEDASLYYTTNGSTPTTSDTFLFNGGSIFLSSITTLKAKAFKSGYDDSAVATATYNINNGPSVSAGAQQIIATSSTTLQGYVSDDGLTGGGSKFTNWVAVSGPGTVSFGNANQTNTSVTFGSDGIYVLKLSASDGQYTNSSQVTIGVNPTISVAVITPANGSTYTVPTNFLLQATASCTSGGVTQVLFYANDTLVGEATGSPLSFNWKSVFAGNLALRAIAITDDPNNYSLASDPINISVNWPTNVGQITIDSTDLRIPAAGLPVEFKRQYDSRGFGSGSLGSNGRLDYEAIKIERNASLSSGWTGRRTGSLTYWVEDTSSHLITVSLSDSEKFYFRPVAEFLNGGVYTSTINSFVIPRYQQGNRGRLSFVPLVGGQGTLQISPTPSNVGYDDYNFSGWKDSPVQVVQGGSLNPYNPSFTQFIFTGSDGTKYHFNSDGSVASKTDRNGNTVTFSASGIVHSSGKQITFTRDINNFITEVYDPIAQDISGSPSLTFAYDGNANITNFGRLIQRSPAVYENTAFAYTNTAFPHNITSIIDPRGVVASRYEYDASGRLTKQYDAFGRFSIFTYDTVNHRQIATDRLGKTTVQNFTPSGLIASLQDANGGVTSYAYDSQGRKIAETNALGRVTSYAYDSNDQLIGVTTPIGSASSATYNSFGEPLVTTDDLGNSTTNTYDDNGNLLFVTNALNIATAYGYDSQGNRIAETNASGLPEQVIVLNNYDQFGALTNTATLNSSLTVLTSVGYSYDSDGNRITQIASRTTPGGQRTMQTQWIYDAANRLVSTVDALSHTNYTVYNGLDKPLQTIDPLNHTNFFYYDANGQLTNTTYADGLSETTGYDALQRRVSSTDRGGRTTTYVYDGVGHLLVTKYPDGSFLGNSYDLLGHFQNSTITTPSSGLFPDSKSITTAQYGYDAGGRQTSITNALNQVTLYAYDANGNQTNMVDALNHTNSYVYDALNRQIGIIYPNGTSENYGYDGIGRQIAVTNQAGIVTVFAFDALSRMIAVTNNFGGPNQTATGYVYDEVGNLTQQVDALNRTNLFEYDDIGRRTKTTFPGGQSSTFGFDAMGNLIRETNFNGVIITNQYNDLNRVTSRTSGGDYSVLFSYSPTGQRTNMIDASGTNIYSYDSFDRLLTKVTPQGTLNYTYDGFGNLSVIQSTTLGGVSMTYGYDALNRVTNVVDRFTNSTTYGFDAVGNLQIVVLPNKVTNNYVFDSLNRLTNLTAKSSGGTLANFSYKLSLAGNRTNLIEALNGVNRTNVWIYDQRYRLTSEAITASASPTGTITNQYDAVGNRTVRSSTVAGVTNQAFSFTANDQLTSDLYDSNGNTRTNGGNVFLYDADNHLTNATVNGTSVIVVYDGDGNRVRKIVGGTTNSYLVDDRNPTGLAQVLEEKTGTTLTRTYTYGLTLISEQDSTTHFYGFDGKGNTRYLTGTNAAITDTYAYDAYGTLIASSGTTTNSYLYSGEQFDPDLGLYYLRARYMNAGSARFWTRDSFEGRQEDPKSLHRYAYGEGDPVNNTDPTGHDVGDISGMLDALRSPVTVIALQRAQQTIQQVTGTKRPSSKDFWAAYPNYDLYKQQDVWKKVGGNIGASYGPATPDMPDGQNSCATRMSYGLNYGGAPIPAGTRGASRNFPDKSYAGKKGDDKRYIVSAANMNAYLTKIWGAPDNAPKTEAELSAIIKALKDGQCAIFACKDHTGVLKGGYQDPYVFGELPINVWILPVP